MSVPAASGFSLLETMVVVAILSVVAALVVPDLLPVVVRQRHAGATSAAAAFVARARQEAISRRRCVRVRVEPDADALVSEVLNSFDCDTPDDAARVNREQELYLPLARQTFPGAVFTMEGEPARPAGEPLQWRFRPSGRLWAIDGDGATPPRHRAELLAVRFGNSPDVRDVVVESQGLLCTHPSRQEGVPSCTR